MLWKTFLTCEGSGKVVIMTSLMYCQIKLDTRHLIGGSAGSLGSEDWL